MLVGVSVDPGFRRIDYDRNRLKEPLKKVGKDVQKIARKNLSSKAVSKPGGFPGMQSGEMRRSIRYKVSRSGYSVYLYPAKTKKMQDFYPAFVIYGHRAPGSETEKEARSHKKRVGKKVAEPRMNPIVSAAIAYEDSFKSVMSEALDDAIKRGDK